jgi:hydrogenase maturation protein HypF
MPGGEAAIREPWRMAISYLVHSFGFEFCSRKLPFIAELDPKRIALAVRMIERKVNAPLTSSCGRLFDAVASIAGIRQEVTYEGQAAIELEMAADGGETDHRYPFEIRRDKDGFVIDTSAMVQALAADVLADTPVADISARFHNGLAEVLARTVHLVRESTGLCRVCASGGIFNNRLLLRKLGAFLEADGFEVFTQHQVPCGDGGLCLGQAMIAAHRCG